jgi:hypothetical protein
MSEMHSGASIWLRLAAMPTFAMMALTAGFFGGGPGYMLCSADPAPLLNGMVPMYLLMSAFHSPPWLKLISGRSRRFIRIATMDNEPAIGSAVTCFATCHADSKRHPSKSINSG